jgi:ferritin-like metal-binding protein YciE
MDNPIVSFLDDTIAAEKSFQTQLNGFAKSSSRDDARALFAIHADETRTQYELLTARLHQLGAEPSAFKSVIGQLFGAAPTSSHLGSDDAEHTTQDLILAFSVENAEVALYEALKNGASLLGDSETEALAKQIQSQEKETAERVWKLIAPAASEGYNKVVSPADNNPQEQTNLPRETVTRHLQNAEAAERSFADTLAGASMSSTEPEVQAAFASMAQQAKVQHQRLETRLRVLGGTPSTAKNILDHFLPQSPANPHIVNSALSKTAQNLVIAYGAAALQIGTYEALAVVAEAAGDADTARLARELQSEEKNDQKQLWKLLENSTRIVFEPAVART